MGGYRYQKEFLSSSTSYTESDKGGRLGILKALGFLPGTFSNFFIKPEQNKVPSFPLKQTCEPRKSLLISS